MKLARLIGGVFCVCLIAMGCGQSRGVQPSQAVKGVLDLRAWDFNKNGIVKLDGEWEFYWKQLLFSEAGNAGEGLRPSPETTYSPFPSYWDQLVISGKKLPIHGYATYALRILLPENTVSGPQQFAMKLGAADTAYALYANDKLVAHNGIVGKDATSMNPRWISLVSQSLAGGNEAFLILQVSNFYYFHGGMRNSIEFGPEQQIYRKRAVALAQEVFIAGCIFLMGIYHIILFLLRRQNKSVLYFAIACFFIAIRSLLTNEGLLKYLLQNWPWELLTKIEYLSAYFTVAIFVAFMRALFPIVYSWRTAILFVTIFSAISLFIVLFPADVYSRLNIYFQMLLLSMLSHSIYALVRGYKYYRKDMVIFSAGFIFMVVTTVNDILLNQNVIKSIYLVQVGMLVFLLAQSFLLSVRFAQAFSDVELLSAEMQKKNLELLTLDKLKDEFLSNLSHELRTPLASIQMHGEFLEDGIDDETVRRDALKQIGTDTRQLNYIIERMLFLSKVEIGEAMIRITEFEAVMAIQSCIKEITWVSAATSQNGDIEPSENARTAADRLLIVPALLHIRTDQELFKKLVLEILDNFQKFAGGAATLNISVQEDNDQYKIEFTDDGVGVPVEFMAKIGLKFQRADQSLTYVESGTGIGLYLVKKISELLGGKTEFSTVEPQGLCVAVFIEKGKQA